MASASMNVERRIRTTLYSWADLRKACLHDCRMWLLVQRCNCLRRASLRWKSTAIAGSAVNVQRVFGYLSDGEGVNVSKNLRFAPENKVHPKGFEPPTIGSTSQIWKEIRCCVFAALHGETSSYYIDHQSSYTPDLMKSASRSATKMVGAIV